MKNQIIAIAVASAILAACGGEQRSHQQAAQQSAAPTMAAAEMAASAPMPARIVAQPVAAYPKKSAAEQSENSSETEAATEISPEKQPENAANALVSHSQPTHRPFVITADLRFRTDDVRKTSVAIEQLAVQQGGFVVSNETQSHVSASEHYKQADGMILNIEHYYSRTDLLVRVPSRNAQAFLHALQPHVMFLEQHTYQAEDIFANMQREILTAQREQDKIKALQQLNQQNRHATHSEREQTIDNQFHARERQDEAKIQQATLKDKVDYATISLHFRQPESVMKSTTVDSQALAAQHRPALGASLKQALLTSWDWLFQGILFFMKTWFVWLGVLSAWILWQQKSSPKRHNPPSSKDKSDK